MSGVAVMDRAAGQSSEMVDRRWVGMNSYVVVVENAVQTDIGGAAVTEKASGTPGCRGRPEMGGTAIMRSGGWECSADRHQ